MTIRTALRQPTTVVLLAAMLLALSVALPACRGGGNDDGGGDQDAEALLDKAFGEPVPSADVDIDLQLDVEGVDGMEDPLRVRATGPYVRSEKSLPRLDLDVAVEAQGAGQAIQSGILSTGDRVFLKFGGAFYEQPPEQVAQTNRRLARENGGNGSLSDLGLDARKWIEDARLEGEEEIGGVTTEHVTGTLDVRAAVSDINRLVKQSAGALAESAEAARPLRPKEIDRLASSVDNPTFDVYVGKDDDIVRRVTLRIEVDVPERQRADVGGVTGASIRFSAQLDDVGGDQEVRAPRTSRPLSDLTSQLGNLGAIAGGLAGGGDATTTPAPDASGGTAPELDDFERYANCLDAADPNDAAAIADCRALLP